MKKNEWIIIIALLTILYIPFIRIMGKYIAFGDLPTYPLTYKEGIKYYFSSIQPLILGLYTAQSFELIVRSILTLLFSARIQSILYASSLSILFIISYFVLKKFNDNFYSNIIGALFFVLTPVIVGETSAGNPLFWILIAIPPAIYTLIKFIDKEENYLTLFLIIVYMCLFSLYTILLLAPMIITLIFFIKDIKTIIKLLITIMLGICIAVMINYPFYYFFLNKSYEYLSKENATVQTTINDILIKDVLYTYSNSYIFNLIKISNVFCNAGYCNMSFPSLVGIYFWLLIIIGLANLNKVKNKKIYIASLTVVIITYIFIWLTKLRITLFVFKLFPILFIFRNPMMLMYVPSFCYAILINELIKDRKSFTISLLILLIFSSPGLYDLYSKLNNKIIVPNEFLEIDSFINDSNDYYILLLPWNYDEEEIKIKWIYPKILNVPLGLLQYYDKESFKLIENIYQSICYPDENFTKLLNEAGVKYLLVYKNTNNNDSCMHYKMYGTDYIKASPNELERIIDNIKGLKKIKENQNFNLYLNTYFNGIITSNSNITIKENNLYEYKLKFSTEPSYVYLKLPYNKNWVAISENQTFKSENATKYGYGNMFLINKITKNLTIRFNVQDEKSETLKVSLVGILLFICTLFIIRKIF